MEKEDKIAFAVLSTVAAIAVVGVMLGVRLIGVSLFGWFADSETVGVGFRDAFIYAIALSFFVVLVFALFAGDGVLGELPTVVIAFFLFVIFFTVSIAWIF